jgi:predicted dehydrogenase
MGAPEAVLASRLRSVYSRDVEDTVYALFGYAGGASGQLEANWSDESYRKMTTTLAVYGTKGKILADRQECQVFLKAGEGFEDYSEGWTTRYITDLQAPTAYYLRGEEYSSQIDDFMRSVKTRDPLGENSFESATATDEVIERILRCNESKG